MMKHFLLIIKVVVVCSFGLLLYSCVSGYDEGYAIDSHLTEEARRFVISDTINNSFKMIDNHGISFQFLNQPYFGKNYWRIGDYYNDTYEEFGIYTQSQLSGYSFSYTISSFSIVSRLHLSVIYGIPDYHEFVNFGYEFNGKRWYDGNGPSPDVKFYDSIDVRGTVYQNIMEIDYSKTGKSDNAFPVKIYYSGKTGLIKFIRKDAIFFERL